VPTLTVAGGKKSVAAINNRLFWRECIYDKIKMNLEVKDAHLKAKAHRLIVVYQYHRLHPVPRCFRLVVLAGQERTILIFQRNVAWPRVSFAPSKPMQQQPDMTKTRGQLPSGLSR